MPTNIVGNPANADYGAPVTIPANGDQVAIPPYWDAGIQQLADRSEDAGTRLGTFDGSSGEWLYPSSVPRQKMIDARIGKPNREGETTYNNVDTKIYLQSVPVELLYQIEVPGGSRITGVSARVSAGVFTGTGVRISVYKTEYNINSVLIDTVADSTGTLNQLLSITMNELVDNTDTVYSLVIKAGGGASVADPDTVRDIRITFNDPGPRNF